MRGSWEDYFMTIARLVATRATCDRKHVGAVLTIKNHIISTGYNGAPSGLPHCDDVGHDLSVIDGNETCVRTTHAEINAIIAAAGLGRSTAGATMYVTAKPCLNCAKAIITAGIRRVYFAEPSSDPRSLFLLQEADVEVIHLAKGTRDL